MSNCDILSLVGYVVIIGLFVFINRFQEKQLQTDREYIKDLENKLFVFELLEEPLKKWIKENEQQVKYEEELQ